MLTLSATDTLQAKADTAGMTYSFDYTQVVAGVHTFNPTPVKGNINTPTAAVVWPALGQQALARFKCYNSGAGPAPTIVFLYKNGSTDVEAVMSVPAGGWASFDGIEPRVFNAAGTRQ